MFANHGYVLILIAQVLGARHRFNDCASNHFECIKHQISREFTRISDRSEITNDWINTLHHSIIILNATNTQQDYAMDDLKSSLGGLIARVSAHDDEINNMHVALELCQSEKDEISSEVRQLQEHINELETQIGYNQNELIDLKKYYQGLQNRDEDIRNNSILPAKHNKCSSAPCLNNGTCEDQVNGYVCHCLPGYEIPNCKPEPCRWPLIGGPGGNAFEILAPPGEYITAIKFCLTDEPYYGSLLMDMNVWFSDGSSYIGDRCHFDGHILQFQSPPTNYETKFIEIYTHQPSSQTVQNQPRWEGTGVAGIGIHHLYIPHNQSEMLSFPHDGTFAGRQQGSVLIGLHGKRGFIIDSMAAIFEEC